MIKLVRPQPSNDLNNKLTGYHNALITKINNGEFNRLSDKDKKNLQSKYNHKLVKEELLAFSNQKCVYCECKPNISNYMEIDH